MSDLSGYDEDDLDHARVEGEVEPTRGHAAGVDETDSDGRVHHRPRPPAPGIQTLLGIGLMIGLCVGIGVFLGVLADSSLGTSPLLALAGVFIGILCGAGGAYQLIRPYIQSKQL